MLSDELRQAIKGDVLRHRLLWVASISSIAIYCVVAAIVAQQGGEGRNVTDMVRWALMAAGAGMLVGAFCVRHVLLSPARVRTVLEAPPDIEEMARNPNTGQIQQERLALLQQLSEEDARLCGLAAACLKPYLLMLAMVDACAIIGLVLAILQRDLNAILPFAVAAGAVSVVHFPNLDGLLEQARLMRRHGAGGQ